MREWQFLFQRLMETRPDRSMEMAPCTLRSTVSPFCSPRACEWSCSSRLVCNVQDRVSVTVSYRVSVNVSYRVSVTVTVSYKVSVTVTVSDWSVSVSLSLTLTVILSVSV